MPDLTIVFVLAAAVLAFAVLGGLESERAGLRRLPASSRLLVTTLAVLVFWSGIWPSGRHLVTTQAQHADDGQAAVAGGIATQVNAPFVEWLRTRMPSRGTYCVRPAPEPSQADWQWMTYRLLPRTARDDCAAAEWLVLYGAADRGDSDRALFGPWRRFARMYALARRRP